MFSQSIQHAVAWSAFIHEGQDFVSQYSISAVTCSVMIHVNLITQNVCLAAYASTAIVDGREKFSSIFIDFANLSAVSVDGMEKFSLNLIDFVCLKAVIVNKKG